MFAGPYGDLRSLMIAKEQTFTLNMKFSLSCDISEGMEFLHKNGILHGNLRSCAIYIEANLAAKVGDWYEVMGILQVSSMSKVISSTVFKGNTIICIGCKVRTLPKKLV